MFSFNLALFRQNKVTNLNVYGRLRNVFLFFYNEVKINYWRGIHEKLKLNLLLILDGMDKSILHA